MRYMFNFENREKPLRFNREKLLLAAQQNLQQLYFMMDTQYEGIYQADARERRRRYGKNSFKEVVEKSKYKFLPDKKILIQHALTLLTQQKSSVFRKGMNFYTEVDYEDVVPGDVIFLSPGDIVPSDVRIVFSKDLEVDQSIYSDSRQPVRKTANYDEGKGTWEQLTNLPNICFAGSKVTGGLARAVVVSTGMATYLSHLLRM